MRGDLKATWARLLLDAQKVGEFDEVRHGLCNAAQKMGGQITLIDIRDTLVLWVKFGQTKSESKKASDDIDITDALWEYWKKAESRQDIIDVCDRLMMVADKLATYEKVCKYLFRAVQRIGYPTQIQDIVISYKAELDRFLSELFFYLLW